MNSPSTAPGAIRRIARLDPCARLLPLRVRPGERVVEPPPAVIQLPPSSAMVSPLIQTGLSRKAARSPISSAVPTRRIGLVAAARCSGLFSPGRRRASMPSVGISPGAIAFSRMPCRPHSTASDFVMASTPAFDMAEGTTKGAPVRTQVTMIDTTAPPVPSAIHRFPTACVTWKVPWKTMSAMAWKARGERSSVRLTKLPAALLTRCVAGRPSSHMAAMAASTASGSLMSTARAWARPGCAAFIAAAAVARTSPRRPQISTLAPSSIRRSAIIRPRPVPPPVTSTRAPSNSPARNIAATPPRRGSA